MQLVINFLTSTGNKDIAVFSTLNGGVISRLGDELKKVGITYEGHNKSGSGCFMPVALLVLLYIGAVFIANLN